MFFGRRGSGDGSRTIRIGRVTVVKFGTHIFESYELIYSHNGFYQRTTAYVNQGSYGLNVLGDVYLLDDAEALLYSVANQL